MLSYPTTCKREHHKTCRDMYWVFYPIDTRIPISEICRQNGIESLLCKVNTCLTIHCWQENETDIDTPGFLVYIDQGNFLCNKFEEHLRHQISKHYCINKKKYQHSNADTPPHLQATLRDTQLQLKHMISNAAIRLHHK